MSGQADAASFEAYLVAAASLAGDHELAVVDLRWALAEELTRAAYRPGTDPGRLRRRPPRRSCSRCWARPSRGVLEQTFEPVPAAGERR